MKILKFLIFLCFIDINFSRKFERELATPSVEGNENKDNAAEVEK